jgi:hypothetical protein
MMNVGLCTNPDVPVTEKGRHQAVWVLAAGHVVWGVCQWVLQVANVPQPFYVSPDMPRHAQAAHGF